MYIKRSGITFLLCLMLWVWGFSHVFAHPLDISATTLSIQGTHITGQTTFHSYEAEALLRRSGKTPASVLDYASSLTLFDEYIHTHLVLISQNAKPCPITNVRIPRQEAYEIISDGLRTEWTAECAEPIATLSVSPGFFLEFPLQTNRLTIYNNQGQVIAYRVLDITITTYTHDLGDTTLHTLQDTDHDGVSDDDEKIYRTNPKNPDTDGDNYSDFEEITLGWNPLDPRIGPGQAERTKPVGSLTFDAATTTSAAPWEVAGGSSALGSKTTPKILAYRPTLPNTGLLDGSGNTKVNALFREVLAKTEALLAPKSTSSTKTPVSWWWVFGAIFVLGFLHAMGPGHAKALLVSRSVDRSVSYWWGVRFVGVFTLTHLADVAILALAARLAFAFYDPTPILSYIQQVSSLLVIGIGATLLVRSIRSLQNKNTTYVTIQEEPSSANTPKSSLALAIIAGLAPCTFGWGLFLLLSSLGHIEWALVFLGALGAGIFVCLLLVHTAVWMARERLYASIPRLGEYSAILGALLLFGSGCFMAWIVFA